MAATTGKVPAGAYWGEIQAAAEARIGYVAMRTAITVAHFEATGEQASFSQERLRTLYTQAIRNREAEAALAAAPANAAIDFTHIGAIPRAPELLSTTTSRRYIVQFEHTVQRPTGIETIWRTSPFDTGIPATKQSLYNKINQDAANLAEDYGDELHLGVGRIRLLAA